MNKEALVIDDDEAVVWVIKKALLPLGYNIVTKNDINSGLKALRKSHQVVLLDLVLPDGNGLDVLSEIKSRHPDSTVIIITAHGRMESAINAMKLGAYDYLEKPFDIEELKIVIDRAWNDILMKDELKRLKSEQFSKETPQMIGKSKKMLKLFKDIGRVASKDVIVLITGESGTGKELVANAIHYNSNRKNGQFVAINSASIPRDLLESELFGWREGAFTGAKSTRKGSIALADSGTLFLDEISEMDINLQAKLLRFIQEKEYTPLGSNETIKSDTRIIGATNRKLNEAVRKGLFREDLYYRFNVVEIKLPPLRERKEDILPLSEYFLRTSENKFETGHKELSDSAIDFLLNYSWPGNIRELENKIKRAVILSDSSVIDKKDLVSNDSDAFSMQEVLEERLNKYLKKISQVDKTNLYETIISEVEKALIKIVLKDTKGNQLKASRKLGINRNTLRAKIKHFKIRLETRTDN